MDQPTPISNVSGDGAEPLQRYATYAPHDIPYSAAFEDSLQSAVLGDSTTASPAKLSSAADDESLPAIAQSELPIALDDRRRVYDSTIIGHARLTHPQGFLHGGPGHAPSDPQIETLAQQLIEEHDIRDQSALDEMLQSEREKAVELLKERMRHRETARESNAQVERELALLSDQMDMELKVLNKARERKMRKQADTK